jgi:general secretion pathway protein E
LVANVQSTSTLGRRGRLELDETLAALVVDGYLTGEDAKHVRLGARAGRSTLELHPLVLIGSAKLVNRRDAAERPLSVETLTEWLAGKAALPYLKIDPMKIDAAAVTQVVSHAYAQRHRALPVEAGSGEVVFATCEPFEAHWAADLAQMLRREVRLVVSNPLDINRYLLEFYGVQRSIQLAQDAKGDGYDNSKIINFEQLVELGKGGELGADDRHVVHIVDWLLQYAFEQRASDIHLEPRRDAGHMRFRIDGVMHKVFELPSPVMTAVTSRVKILSRLDVAEKRRPQDGRIKTRSAGGREVELRISTMPTAFGEKVVMRIFDPDIVVKEFVQLGFSPGEDAAWRAMVERPHGIVLVTGPTGSGKTTTLYAALTRLNASTTNILTVEDPIEYELAGVGQTQVNARIEMTFAKALRAILRQDPDVIMIGEIRDLETAQIAVQASLTGHLVLATLHTNDSAAAVTRLLDMGIEPFLLSSSLLGAVAQRLVRKLCPACKRYDEHGKQWHAVGCDKCGHTGYQGRVGVYELLLTTDEIRAQIHDRASEADIRATAQRNGMRTMREDGERWLADGITTPAELLRVTKD